MMNRNTKWLCLAVTAVLLAGCGKKNKQPDLNASAEPDKILYERALKDIKDGKHIIGRLTLQTLINTYPDSEYLAKAKLAVADSFYKEGGSAGLTQAVAEYEDYVTFFPQTEEAAYARMQTGMAHYRRMEKPDRDRTYTRLAEEKFQQFLKEYPDHPLTAQAEQRLREVQEVLAEGDYRIARYYFMKGSIRAAGGRLIELVDRYPLYSNSDRALFMLGQAFEKSEKGDVAGRYYSRLVRDYPLSELVPEARARLEALGIPVPQPDPAALERQQREAANPESRKRGLLGNTVGRALGMVSTRPDVTRAAKTGTPQLNPPPEPGGEVLTPSPSGNIVTGTSTNSSGATSAEGAPAAGSGSTTPAGHSGSGSPSAGELARVDPAKAAAAKKKEEEEKKRKEKAESSSKKKKGKPW
jgi:outer membrane protein assembly factor BamD